MILHLVNNPVPGTRRQLSPPIAAFHSHSLTMNLTHPMGYPPISAWHFKLPKKVANQKSSCQRNRDLDISSRVTNT